VPLYDTLGENAVDFIVTHSEAGALFASADKLPTLAKALPKLQRGQLRAIVYWGTGAAKDAAFEEARHAPAPARTKPGRRQPIPCLRRQMQAWVPAASCIQAVHDELSADSRIIMNF